MPDSSPCTKKKKLTLVASKKGLEIADKALIRLGFDSKSNFAESQRLSRSTVSNFFNQVPIQLDSFKRICDALKLKWQEIAGITEDSINSEQIERSVNPSPDIEEGAKVKMLVRQVTVIDKQSGTIKSVILLKGEIDSISSLRILATILREIRENGGDTIQIIDIQEGSIKLIIEGSQEDIERLLIQIKSGELTELDGFPVEDAQILSESSEDSESSQQKWRLVEEIVNNPMTGRDLSGADLSDADLSDACLINANLSQADLSGADLSSADLSGANLSVLLSNRLNRLLSDLSGTDLREANLREAARRRALVRRALVRDALLSGANLSGANMRDANMRDAELSGANLSGAKLSGAELSGADLSGANLSGIQVEKTRFRDNLGITEELKKDLINRGAIFEDSPGNPAGILTRV